MEHCLSDLDSNLQVYSTVVVFRLTRRDIGIKGQPDSAAKNLFGTEKWEVYDESFVTRNVDGFS